MKGKKAAGVKEEPGGKKGADLGRLRQETGREGYDETGPASPEEDRKPHGAVPWSLLCPVIPTPLEA